MVTWQDVVLIAEFGVIIYIAWEDRLIRQVEEKSLRIYTAYFDERTKWYKSRGNVRRPAATSSSPAKSAGQPDGVSLPVEGLLADDELVHGTDSSSEPLPLSATEKTDEPPPAPHTPDLE